MRSLTCRRDLRQPPANNSAKGNGTEEPANGETGLIWVDMINHMKLTVTGHTFRHFQFMSLTLHTQSSSSITSTSSLVNQQPAGGSIPAIILDRRKKSQLSEGRYPPLSFRRRRIL